MLSGNSLRQTVHTHRASVHQAAKLVAALLRVVGVTAGLAESNGSLPPGLWLTSPAGWLPRTGISSGTLRSVIEYGLPLPFYYTTPPTKVSKAYSELLHIIINGSYTKVHITATTDTLHTPMCLSPSSINSHQRKNQGGNGRLSTMHTDQRTALALEVTEITSYIQFTKLYKSIFCAIFSLFYSIISLLSHCYSYITVFIFFLY